MQHMTEEQWLKQGLDGTFTEIDRDWNYKTRKVEPEFLPDYDQGVHVRAMMQSERMTGVATRRKPAGGRKKHAFTPEQLQAIRYAKSSGASIREIALRFGVGRKRVGLVLRETP